MKNVCQREETLSYFRDHNFYSEFFLSFFYFPRASTAALSGDLQ